MTKVAIYTDGSGQLHIVIPAPRLVAERVSDGMSEDDIQSEIVNNSVDPSLQSQVVWIEKDQAYSQPRTFRDAWANAGGIVVTDMPKARAIKMQMIRAERDARLIGLDADSLRAVEDGNVAEQDRIKAKKQVLRDLPASVDLDSLADPQALLDFTPPELV